MDVALSIPACCFVPAATIAAHLKKAGVSVEIEIPEPQGVAGNIVRAKVITDRASQRCAHKKVGPSSAFFERIGVALCRPMVFDSMSISSLKRETSLRLKSIHSWGAKGVAFGAHGYCL